jgi:hypothetical protein
LMADPRSMSCLAERWVIYCECGNCLKLKSLVVDGNRLKGGVFEEEAFLFTDMSRK